MTVKANSKRAIAHPHTSAPSTGFSLISHERLLELYGAMVQCRQLEQLGLRQGSSKRSGAIGQEATAAGVLLHLLAEDVLSPVTGNLSQVFLKGKPLEQLLMVSNVQNAKNRKKTVRTRSTKTSENQIIPAAETLEEQLSIAIGVALAHKLDEKTSVTVVFFDADILSEDYWQGLQYAATHALPIVFVHQSTVLPGSVAKDSGVGFVPGIPVDAKDVVAVYRVAHEAITRAREGTGPTLILAQSHLAESSGGSQRKKLSPAIADDPIRRMESYLSSKGIFRPQFKQKVLSTFRKELAAAARKEKIKQSSNKDSQK